MQYAQPSLKEPHHLCAGELVDFHKAVEVLSPLRKLSPALSVSFYTMHAHPYARLGTDSLIQARI